MKSRYSYDVDLFDRFVSFCYLYYKILLPKTPRFYLSKNQIIYFVDFFYDYHYILRIIRIKI